MVSRKRSSMRLVGFYLCMKWYSISNDIMIWWLLRWRRRFRVNGLVTLTTLSPVFYVRFSADSPFMASGGSKGHVVSLYSTVEWLVLDSLVPECLRKNT